MLTYSFSVLKYRETEDGIGKKVQKLNWHSVAKKTNRINQRITQFTGLNTQVLKRSYSSRIEFGLWELGNPLEDFQENLFHSKWYLIGQSLQQYLLPSKIFLFWLYQGDHCYLNYV